MLLVGKDDSYTLELRQVVLYYSDKPSKKKTFGSFNHNRTIQRGMNPQVTPVKSTIHVLTINNQTNERKAKKKKKEKEKRTGVYCLSCMRLVLVLVLVWVNNFACNLKASNKVSKKEIKTKAGSET